MADSKQHIHELIDRLPPAQLSAVACLLEAILDPVSRAVIHAPVEKEELRPETIAALDEAREWLKHNERIPHEQVLSELGITQEEIGRFKEPK